MLKGKTHSAATKEKLRLAGLGRTVSAATRLKLSMRKGWRHTEAAKDKMRHANTGKKRTAEVKEKLRLAGLGRHQSAETKEKLRAAHLGKPKSPGAVAKMRASKTGKKMSPELRAKMSASRKGRYIPPQVREAAVDANRRRTGPLSPLWRGGITAQHFGLRRAIHQIYEYKQCHRDVLLRDNFTCQGCGTHGGDLQVHHIDKFQVIIDRFGILTVEQAKTCAPLWDIQNGVTLCHGCHSKLHYQQTPA